MNITTTRLNISQVSIADAPFILKLMNTPTWHQFIGDRNINTLQDAEKHILSWVLESYDKNGFGPYLVCSNQDDIQIGTCGLFQRDKLDYPDLGFAFLPEYTGLGYAEEASKAVLNFGFNKLKLPAIYAITDHDNVNSQKLLAKLGFVEISMIYDSNSKVFELNSESYI
jgi:[ribosomal protein S5]-alanine N-acetyltransferase